MVAGLVTVVVEAACEEFVEFGHKGLWAMFHLYKPGYILRNKECVLERQHFCNVAGRAPPDQRARPNFHLHAVREQIPFLDR